jgi:hypothetical protein
MVPVVVSAAALAIYRFPYKRWTLECERNPGIGFRQRLAIALGGGQIPAEICGAVRRIEGNDEKKERS